MSRTFDRWQKREPGNDVVATGVRDKQNNYANLRTLSVDREHVNTYYSTLRVLDDVQFKGSSRNAFSSMESSFYFRRRIFVVV